MAQSFLDTTVYRYGISLSEDELPKVLRLLLEHKVKIRNMKLHAEGFILFIDDHAFGKDPREILREHELL